MKKILLVFNGETYNAHLASFGMRMCREVNAVLQGAFTSPFVEQMNTYPFPGELPLVAKKIAGVNELDEEHRNLVRANMELFLEDVKKAKVTCQVAAETDISVQELIDLSAFADLILCDTNEPYGSYSYKDFVGEVHCPVLLVRQRSALPKEVILCYDESFASVNTVRKFCSLFSQWNDLPISIVSISPKGDNGSKVDHYMDEWLELQFSRIERVQLEGNLQKELVGYISTKDKDSIVIMGNNEKNSVSRIFHRSLVNVVLEETSANLFISHD